MFDGMPLAAERDEHSAAYKLAIVATSPKEPSNWMRSPATRICACGEPYQTRLAPLVDMGMCSECIGVPDAFTGLPDVQALLMLGYSMVDLLIAALDGCAMAMLFVIAESFL